MIIFIFFFNDTATTEIYTLSLHDALPISSMLPSGLAEDASFSNIFGSTFFITSASLSLKPVLSASWGFMLPKKDRKSTRLNSSHGYISYAVFCLKKKNIYLNTYLINNNHY